MDDEADEADEAAATTGQKIFRGHQARREPGTALPSSPSSEGYYRYEGEGYGYALEDGEGYGEADVLDDDQYGSEEEGRQLASTEQRAAMKLQSVARGRNVRRDLCAAVWNQCDESTPDRIHSTPDPNGVRAQSHAVAHVRATPLPVRATPLPVRATPLPHAAVLCGRTTPATTPASLAPQSTRMTATSLMAAQPRETAAPLTARAAPRRSLVAFLEALLDAMLAAGLPPPALVANTLLGLYLTSTEPVDPPVTPPVTLPVFRPGSSMAPVTALAPFGAEAPMAPATALASALAP